ncbi:MAG: DUF2752 domain-containing protein [Ferruginibacter sp.]
MKHLLKHIELIFWISAGILLFFMDSNAGKDSICFFTRLGFDWCPGCGIGHSIHSVLHLQFTASFREHPFGIPAVIIIFNRIKQLSFPPKKYYHESKPGHTHSISRTR